MNPEAPMKKKHLRKHKEKFKPDFMPRFRGYPNPDSMYPSYGINPGMGDPSFMPNFDPSYLESMPDYINGNIDDFPIDFESYSDLIRDKDPSDFFRNPDFPDPSSKLAHFPSPTGLDKMKTYKKLAPIQKPKPAEQEIPEDPKESRKLRRNKKNKFNFYDDTLANLYPSMVKDEIPQSCFGKKLFGNLKTTKTKNCDKNSIKEEQDGNSDWQDIGNSSSCLDEEESFDQGEMMMMLKKDESEERFARKNPQVFDASEFLDEKDDLSNISNLSYRESEDEDEVIIKVNEKLPKFEKLSSEIPLEKVRTEENTYVFGALSKMLKTNESCIKRQSTIFKNEKISCMTGKNEVKEEIEKSDLTNNQDNSMEKEEKHSNENVKHLKDLKEKHEDNGNLENEQKIRIKEETKKILEFKNEDEKMKGNFEREKIIKELYENKLENLQEQINFQIGEKEKLEVKYQKIISTLNDSKENLAKEIELIRSKFDHLEEKWKFECELTNKLEKNLSTEKEKYEMMLENEKVKNEKMSDDLRKTIVNLNKDVNAINEQREQIQLENEALNKRIVLLEELSKIQGENNEDISNDQIKELKASLDEVNKANENLKREKTSLENKILTLEKNFSMEQDLKKEMKQLQMEKDKISQQARQSNYENQRLVEENIILQNQIHQLEIDIGPISEHKAKDQIKIEELTRENKELNQSILKVREEYQKLEDELSILKQFSNCNNDQRQIELEEENRTVKNELEIKDQLISDLNLKLQKQSKHIEQLFEQLSESRTEARFMTKTMTIDRNYDLANNPPNSTMVHELSNDPNNTSTATMSSKTNNGSNISPTATITNKTNNDSNNSSNATNVNETSNEFNSLLTATISNKTNNDSNNKLDDSNKVLLNQEIVQTLDQFKLRMEHYERELKEMRQSYPDRKYQSNSEEYRTMSENNYYKQPSENIPITNVKNLADQYFNERTINLGGKIKEKLLLEDTITKCGSHSFPRCQEIPNCLYIKDEASGQFDGPTLKADVEAKVERLKKHLIVAKRQIMNIKV